MTRLKLDQWGSRWSFVRGATKATQRTKGQSIAELTDALAQVDGLLAGVNCVERLDPAPDDTDCSPAQSSNAKSPLPTDSTTDSWFGPLTADLSQANASGSEDRSNVDIRQIRNILNEKLINSHDNPRGIPRQSQWATIRSLRKASMFHYNQFTRATADSTSPEIRKLRKSYVTAKNMLEMGILTFRDVLHGHTPTTLVDIFAFASLSYVISKTLHAKGHIDESEILSGILDWRAAIADEKERSAFDEIAKRLWAEAKEIMHFFPLEKTELDQETPGLRHDGGASRYSPSIIPQAPLETWPPMPGQEYTMSPEDPVLWNHEYTSNFQQTSHTPCPDDFQNHMGGLENLAHQLIEETMAHEDFMFSTWLNLDPNLQDDLVDPYSHQSTPNDIDPNYLDPSQTDFSTGTESAASKSPSSLSDGFEETPGEDTDPVSKDSALDRLINTTLFQVVFRFITRTSEMGDLLDVLSGRGLTSGKNGMKSSHPCPPWVAFEFLDQAPKHFFGPLHREALQIDETFSGIVAMAETFVRLGSLHTVREVENYIITVGRHLALSYDIFAKLVSKTLIQCLIASQNMKWNLLYPSCIQEADEYSIEYVSRREKSEKNWSESGVAKLELLEEEPSPISYTTENIQKHSPKRQKSHYYDESNSPAKRRRRYTPNTPSGSDASIIEHCPVEGCPKSYTGKAAYNNLSRHVRTKHNEKNLKCPNCTKETPRRDNLRQHFLKLHSDYQLPDWLANKGRGLSD